MSSGGRLIFALPKTDMMMHESDENDMHELHLMTDDLDAEMAGTSRNQASRSRK